MNANNGHGYDHVCTVNERHALWDPQTRRHGERCWLYVDGERCPGKFQHVGIGSRKNAPKAAA